MREVRIPETPTAWTSSFTAAVSPEAPADDGDSGQELGQVNEGMLELFQAFPAECVGYRVSIKHRTMEGLWLEGVITGFDENNLKHKVYYENRQLLWIDLRTREFVFKTGSVLPATRDRLVKDSPADMVGMRFTVCPNRRAQQWFKGVVIDFDVPNQRHRVQYDTKEMIWVKFGKKHFQLEWQLDSNKQLPRNRAGKRGRGAGGRGEERRGEERR
jgi:hypothetical protein